MPVMMRIGRSGNYLDNAHAGGMFIAVDDDGTLHDRAFTEFKEEFTKHPDTGVVFENYKIENFPKVLEAAKRMSSMVPQVGCVHWDFTIDDEGEPLLIEGNMKFGSVWMIEMARGVAPFGERTEEVLRWLGKMRKTKASERYKYLYGKE
jgi:D-alanine-D-alanine ligase-like ATP-grasp enzyme